MKRRNFRMWPAAACLAALLLLSLFLPYSALAAEGGPVQAPGTQSAASPAESKPGARVTIRTAEDLMELARNCTLNTWSRDKTVSLEADLDLSGLAFSPIPTFGGTFEGNGHTISGLSLSGGASCQGLFRYIQEGAVVRDLQVTGTVTAVGEQAYIGGIAGSNEGTILDCSFRGTVEGKAQVGGIAGVNEASGSIYRCTAEGTVTGEKSTGGIAGQNGGTITGCINKSNVNTVHAEKEQTLEDSFDNLSREDVLDTTTDTGGIAGFSNGVLRSCRNVGHVGYPHVGYNVGGVVGRSSGYLENCINTGAVEGRKDVGGVAGQIAPNIRLIFSPDTINELKDALDRLGDLVDDTLDHTDSSWDTINDRLDQLSNYTQSAADNASDLANIMGDWADSGIDTINGACDALADTLDRLEEITSNAEDILDTMADGMDILEDCLDQMSHAMDTGEEGLDDLSGAVEDFRKALRHARDGFDNLRQALRDLSNALVVEDWESVERALSILKGGAQDLSDALEDCGEAMEELCFLLEAGEWDSEELTDHLIACLYLLKDGFEAAADTAAALGDSIAAALDGASLDWDAVRQSARRIVQVLGKFSDFCDSMDSSLGKLRDTLSQFSHLSGDMADISSDLADAMDLFEDSARDMGDVADQVHDLFQDLSERDPIQFDKLGDDFHQAEDGLHSAVNGIGDQMDLLRGEMTTSGDTLSNDIRDLGDQFQVIADLILDAFNDAKDTGTDGLWDDVSQERINSTTLGKAKGCTNFGAVAGDLNVGGITGAMAIEHDFDPEDDITEVGEESLDFRYETRAILQDCINQGPVTAKKDGAGGAVGRMDLGYVLNCENYGAAESTGGDYAGGIAGVSRSTIRGCWSKCALSGGSYVGGIVGRGCEVYQCVSLVSVTEAEGYFGAVAGDWDREDGALEGNRFVSNTLAGVDGISYAGQAEPVAYGDLVQEDGVPSPFYRLTVTYVAEDRELETVSFSYGQDLSGRQTLEVPKKEGYYGVWEEIGEEAITTDHVVEAVYTPYTTTLASGAMRDSAHPVLLVEGTFDGASALEAEVREQSDKLERWTVTLTGMDAEGEHVVRYAPPKEWTGVSLRLLTPDGSQNVEVTREGSCYVFRAVGSAFTFEAVRTSPASILHILLPVLAVLGLVVLAAAFLLHQSSRFKSNPRRKNDTPAPASKV